MRLLTLAALFILAIPAIQPLMRGALPLTADGTLHLYRLIALDHALSDGTLWARYAAGMAYGYGTPMFNYYSPLSLYPMLLLYKLGMSFLQSWLWGMSFYTLVAAFGTYRLGRLWSGEVGGIISAAAYIYAPYMLYDALWRGTVAEYASLALLPYVLWALTCAAQKNHCHSWIAVCLAFALFIPMHNVITLHGVALIGVFTLFLWLQHGKSLKSGIRLFSPLLIGFMLTAFFWLPALTETQYVKLDAITATNPTIDVVGNLTDLENVLTLPITADPTQLQPPISIALSWTQIVLAAVGVVLVWRRAPTLSLRVFVLLLAVLIALLIFMNTHASALIWQTLPLIRYSQFPSRLIGLASFLLAVLAGIGVSQLLDLFRSHTRQGALLCISLTGIIIYGFPYLYPIYLPDIDPQNIVDLHDFERDSGFTSTSSFGEYLPIWNYEAPDPDKLISRYQTMEIIPRLQPPGGVTLENAVWRNTSGAFEITTENETVLNFDWFYFPGWQATLNGQPLELTPTTPEGLISAAVPAGTHQVEIWLANTERQTLGWMMSGLGLLGLIAGGFVFRRIESAEKQVVPVSTSLITIVLVTGVLLSGLKLLVIDRIDSPIRRQRFEQEQPVMANFASAIALLDYHLIPSEREIDYRLYWRLYDGEVETDYSSVIRLIDSDGIAYVQQTQYQPGGLATRHWLPGYYIEERGSLQISPDTPPGNYQVELSLYDPASARSLDVINADGNPDGVAFSLGTIEIQRPAAQSVDLDNSTAFTPALSLVGGLDLPDEASVGQEIQFFWRWHLMGEQADITVRLEWLQNGEVKAATADFPLVSGFPLNLWQVGDLWRGAHRVYVPGDLQGGVYEVAVALENQRIVMDTMNVTAPERIYALPKMDYRSGETWENGISLLGYDIDTENKLTLYWQTSKPLAQNLNVFVHVVNDSEVIVEQVSGVPVSYTRPTPGWAIDEIIADRINITFPLGEGLQVRVGWFDPITGERVKLTNGSDFIVLTN
jgi:uncharacterized membrane protein YidH (DUF202 family)